MNDYFEKVNANIAAMERVDIEARDKGQLLSRYITHPYADGYAYYKIVKVNPKTVRIKVMSGLGDDWVLPAWGEEATISRPQAEAFLVSRDNLAKLFRGAAE